MSEPIVITGTGLLCGLGRQLPLIWRRLHAGETARFRVPDELRDVLPPIGIVPALRPRQFLDRRRARFMTRDAVVGFGAVTRAVRASGLAPELVAEAGCFVGAPLNFGDAHDFRLALEASVDGRGRFHLERFADEARLMNPLTLIRGLANGLLWCMTMEYGLRGMNTNICSGGISSTLALGQALLAIRSGRIRRALVAGYDGTVSVLAAFEAEGSRTRPRRPLTPAGMAPFGEVGAAVVLERESEARRRGAPILAELAGWGCDFQRAGEKAGGAAMQRAVERALTDAGEPWESVDYVHTDAFDGAQHWRCASRALRRAGNGSPVPISSTSFAIGYAPAAAGAAGALFSGLALRSGRIPPTARRRRCSRAGAPPPLERSIRRPLRTAVVLTGNETGERAALVLRRAATRGGAV